MAHSSAFIAKPLGIALLLTPVTAALAQAPVIMGITPLANARTAARTSPVTVSFNQPLAAGSAGALKVFSAQRGGLRTRGITPAVVSGSSLSFAPTAHSWMPGETVQYSVTMAAAGSGGALGQARVGQFTAAVGGTGRGDFIAPTPGSVGVGQNPNGIALADLDGDGDLDVATAEAGSNSVSIRFNDGLAHFISGTTIALSAGPGTLALGDVDGDGDVDVVATMGSNATASVRLNDGRGSFGGGTDVAVGYNPAGVVLADFDGDGDLDLATTSYTAPGTVSIRLNNGAGVFTPPASNPNPGVGLSPFGLKAGDVDADGDLDLFTANLGDNAVRVLLNNGRGSFGGGSSVAVAGAPYDVAVGDVDGDGDLDLVTACPFVSLVSVRLNNGQGLFASPTTAQTRPRRLLPCR